MPSQPKNAYGNTWDYQAFAKCSFCGQDYPARLVWYNPRFGWQCFKCWDGLIQRDQIIQPIFPYEGTRKTPAPLTNTLEEGITPGTLYANYTWVFLDNDGSGRLWSVNFNEVPFLIPVLTTVVPDTQDKPFDYVVANNEARIYVQNGVLMANQGKFLNDGYAIQLCDTGCSSVFVTPQNQIQFVPCVTVPAPFLLYDRSFPDNIYLVTFTEFVTVTRSTGPAVGGILLNDGWSFFIDVDMANYNQVPFADERPWDQPHQFYVDTTTYGFPELIYIP